MKKTVILGLLLLSLAMPSITSADGGPERPKVMPQEPAQKQQERERVEKKGAPHKAKVERDQPRQRVEREKHERQRVERDQHQRERVERDKHERERVERERHQRHNPERDKHERERLERERRHREQAERDKHQREQRERERLERERQHRERNDHFRDRKHPRPPEPPHRDRWQGRHHDWSHPSFHQNHWRPTSPPVHRNFPFRWHDRLEHYSSRYHVEPFYHSAWRDRFPGLHMYRWADRHGDGFWYHNHRIRDAIMFYSDSGELVSVGFFYNGAFVMLRDDDSGYESHDSFFMLQGKSWGIIIK